MRCYKPSDLIKCLSTHNPVSLAMAGFLFVSLAATASFGTTGTLGIYFDQAGTTCSSQILPGVPTEVYVVARFQDTTCGLAGGEFRFAGVPDSWQVYPVPREDLIVIGNPFITGATFAFTSDQQPVGGAVHIFSVLVLASALEQDVEFQIHARNPPSNPNLNCAHLILCREQQPVFDVICVGGISCHVNPTVPKACEVAVAVENTQWGAVKRLFQ